AAKRGLNVAVERATDAGNLPLAVAAACKLREAGGDHESALALVAKVFARGSSRLLDKRGAPPGLPAGPGDFTPLADSLKGQALLDEGGSILEAACQTFADDRAKDAPPKVPPQALFSSLDEKGLQAMIEIF